MTYYQDNLEWAHFLFDEAEVLAPVKRIGNESEGAGTAPSIDRSNFDSGHPPQSHSYNL